MNQSSGCLVVEQHAKGEKHRDMLGEKCLWDVRYRPDSMFLHVGLGSEKMNHDSVPFKLRSKSGDEKYQQNAGDEKPGESPSDPCHRSPTWLLRNTEIAGNRSPLRPKADATCDEDEVSNPGVQELYTTEDHHHERED